MVKKLNPDNNSDGPVNKNEDGVPNSWLAKISQSLIAGQLYYRENQAKRNRVVIDYGVISTCNYSSNAGDMNGPLTPFQLTAITCYFLRNS